jgi:hypothetical protein
MLEMDPAGQGRGRLLGKIRWLWGFESILIIPVVGTVLWQVWKSIPCLNLLWLILVFLFLFVKEKKKKIVPYIVNIDEMKKLMPFVQKSMCLLNSLDLFISFCK